MEPLAGGYAPKPHSIHVLSCVATAIIRLAKEDYRQLAPYVVDNHPTEEHLLPLFVALGTGGENPKGRQLHSSYTYGVFSMSAYASD